MLLLSIWLLVKGKLKLSVPHHMYAVKATGYLVDLGFELALVTVHLVTGQRQSEADCITVHACQ